MWCMEAERPVASIVIVHGACEHSGRYKWLSEMWRSSGYNVVMGDLPGQGTSTRDRGHIRTFQEYIDEVDKWIDRAKAFQVPVLLLGHSMGGLIAIEWFKQRQSDVAGLILSSPCLGLQLKPNKFLDVISKGLNVVAPSLRFESGITPDKATRNKEVIEVDINDSLYITKVSVRWYQEILKAIQSAMEPTDAFLNIPLLVMQGGTDWLVDKKMVLKWFDQLASRNKTYREWEGLYHEIFNEPEREDVFKAAKAFAEQHIT
ncbi:MULTISPECIES: alpha/beta hydrolase [Bacillus]|uniref:alpha/beta hydrolase n=1 Tax=Bacillus TaxID=1386 RepID=UPI000402B964|nr:MULTISPECIES: alpha/beta hydrolase [Bacillus]QHZ48155.1 alpha/beta hydrolase [Bacillus sp. NSP9.1]WFA04229.1 alpha/beta hydrolase [Bacillus sp. HSf4]